MSTGSNFGGTVGRSPSMGSGPAGLGHAIGNMVGGQVADFGKQLAAFLTAVHEQNMMAQFLDAVAAQQRQLAAGKGVDLGFGVGSQISRPTAQFANYQAPQAQPFFGSTATVGGARNVIEARRAKQRALDPNRADLQRTGSWDPVNLENLVAQVTARQQGAVATSFGANVGSLEESLRNRGGNTRGGNRNVGNHPNTRATANRNDAGARQYVRDNFGAMAAFLDHPELGTLLLKAGHEDWDISQLETALKGTRWYQERSIAQSGYDRALIGHPAELEQMRIQQRAIVYNLARTMGITNEIDLNFLAELSLRNGMGPEEIGDILASAVTMDTTKKAGAAQMAMATTKTTAADYYIKMTDQQALDFAKRQLSQELSPTDFAAWAQQQAKAQYSHLSDVLDKGVTMRQHFAGAQSRIAELLETNVEDIDIMNDEKWHQVTGIDDNGKKRAMTAFEIADLARADKRWDKTDNAKQLAHQLVGNLSKVFGAQG